MRLINYLNQPKMHTCIITLHCISQTHAVICWQIKGFLACCPSHHVGCCTPLRVPDSSPDCSGLNQLLGGRQTKVQVLGPPVTHVGCPDGVPSSRVTPGHLLTIMDIWAVNQGMEDSLPLSSLSLSLSPFLIFSLTLALSCILFKWNENK